MPTSKRHFCWLILDSRQKDCYSDNLILQIKVKDTGNLLFDLHKPRSKLQTPYVVIAKKSEICNVLDAKNYVSKLRCSSIIAMQRISEYFTLNMVNNLDNLAKMWHNSTCLSIRDEHSRYVRIERWDVMTVHRSTPSSDMCVCGGGGGTFC